jgi:hypothetical protein
MKQLNEKLYFAFIRRKRSLIIKDKSTDTVMVTPEQVPTTEQGSAGGTLL